MLFKVPLRASFLLARPGLEKALVENQDDLVKVGVVSYNFGLYEISKAYRGCHKKDRVFFQLRNDSEAAFIHSRSGIDDLCYNAGKQGTSLRELVLDEGRLVQRSILFL